MLLSICQVVPLHIAGHIILYGGLFLWGDNYILVVYSQVMSALYPTRCCVHSKHNNIIIILPYHEVSAA